MNQRRTVVGGAVTASLMLSGLGAVAFAGPASARGAEALSAGTCAGIGAWKLKAKAQDRAIELAYELDARHVGQRWQVNLFDNGGVVGRGTFVTAAPSGSFEVRHVVANRIGTERSTATTRNTATGAICRGTLNFAG